MKETMTNPLTIMLINMTIVFAVLYLLGWIIRLIRYIDPTRKKEEAPAAPAPAVPAAAPVAATTETRLEEDELEIAAVIAAALAANEDELEIAAVIAAAVAAYGGQARRIVSVRPAPGQSWARAARLEVVNTRNQMG